MITSIETARLCARALSRPVFNALARGERPERVFDFLRDVPLPGKPATVAELLASAFNVLQSTYRNEYVYKTAIANRIVFGRHSPRTASVSIELPVGNSIVDVAIFNGTSTAYEIKTDLDSPRRLSTQTSNYLLAFDRVYVVTGPDSIKRYQSECDERVGILALGRQESLTQIRPAISNALNVDPRVLFQMLRRSEYQALLERHYGAPIVLPNGIFTSHCRQLFEALPSGIAQQGFLKAMRQRSTTNSSTAFLKALPAHLRVLGFATPLSPPQRAAALQSLDIPLTFS